MDKKINKHNDIKNQNRMVYTIMAVSLALLGILIAISVMSARRSDVKNSADARDAATVAAPAAVESEENVPAAFELPDLFPNAETIAKETESAAAKNDEPLPSAKTDALPTFIPVALGPVSKGFSMDVPVYSATMEDYRVHRGVDVSVPVGSDVFAAANGTVTAVWEDPMSGCALRIEHSGGAVSTYYNLSPETIDVMKPGMEVVSGGVVGTVGDTSLLEIAEEPHVHYELTINGEYVDPCAYMDFTNVGASYEG